MVNRAESEQRHGAFCEAFRLEETLVGVRDHINDRIANADDIDGG